MKPTLVLMAAGLGSRFKEGVKQLANVGPAGERLMDFAVYDAKRAGFGRVVFIVRHEHQDEFRASAKTMGLDDHGIAVQRLEDVPAGFSAAGRSKPWGTGQAVLAAREFLDTPFVVTNADDFYGTDAYAIAARMAEHAVKGVTTIVGMRLAETLSPHGPVTRGVCDVNAAGDVTSIEEVQDISQKGSEIVSGSGARRFTGREIVSMNFWVFPVQMVRHLERHFADFLKREGADPKSEYRLPDIVNALIKSRDAVVRATEVPGPWFGLTFAADRPAVVEGLAELTRRGVYPTPLWKQKDL